ncbi:MAG: hypothetical protein HYX49_02945 [Chloroflexi bacterium]|nr:hypothetical protein [Chloroflexota bacterium]
MKIRDHTGEWLQFLYLDLAMNKEQKRARELIDKVVQIIVKQNDQVSPRIIYSRVISDLLQSAIFYPKDYPDFSSAAKEEMQILFEYKASRPVDVPLVYLVVEDLPVNFGLVTIYNVTEEDRNQKWWKNVLASGGENYSVRTYARAMSKGDLQISLENAKATVNDMLTFLRAIGFPLTLKPQNQFGLINEYSALLIPYRLGVPKENFKLEYPVQLSTATSALHTYEIRRDIFSRISQTTLARINKLINEDYPKPSTDLKRKFFLGLHWLGEATKPDIVNARFVKLFLSLEGLIGGEINDSRETKIILAKRSAIVTQQDIKEQKKLYNSILRYYKIRSEIVHGVHVRIAEKDFLGFGECVRKVTWSMLEIIDNFKDISELHKWLSAQSSWSLLQQN